MQEWHIILFMIGLSMGLIFIFHKDLISVFERMGELFMGESAQYHQDNEQFLNMVNRAQWSIRREEVYHPGLSAKVFRDAIEDMRDDSFFTE